MDELTKAELARIRDEDQRQNRRIELLEDMILCFSLIPELHSPG